MEYDDQLVQFLEEKLRQGHAVVGPKRLYSQLRRRLQLPMNFYLSSKNLGHGRARYQIFYKVR